MMNIHKRKMSALWRVFTITDKVNKMAICGFCGHHLSYKSSITNLKKHLERKHPDMHVSAPSQKPAAAFEESESVEGKLVISYISASRGG